VSRARLGEGGIDLFVGGHINLAENTADLLGDGLTLLLVEVEQRDLCAKRCERPRGGRTEAGSAAGDDGGNRGIDFHGVIPSRSKTFDDDSRRHATASAHGDETVTSAAARVFVTGSADRLGKMAAELLIKQGHKVVLHARSTARADETRNKVVGAEGIVIGDLSSITQTKFVADQVNKLGKFDAVTHNAGIGYREPTLVRTADGVPQLFAVNTLAPYILTALITMPKRLVYLSSGMHYGAGSHLMTYCGRNGVGTARKLTRKPSFRTCCWRSRSRGYFPR
jgi:short chain dehydrogenase